MYKILDNEDLDKLMNLPEDELNSFLEIKIPDSNIIADPLQENVQTRNIGHEHGYFAKLGRCKLCKTGYTKVYCTKCGVRLCSVPNRMCSNDYHR